MTYEEIFEKSKEIIMQADVSGFDNHLAIQVDITGEGEGAFYIELKDKELHIEPYEYYDHDCKFIISAKNFLKLIDGSLNPVAAFTVGKLKVEGSIEKALEFQKIAEAVKPDKKAEKKAKKAEKTASKKTSKKSALAS
ncbi:MAG: SCP2 sterol-binding domain-containing protein [Oscillospiraceae bacterium]|nr:SCP2 sterol-binding domain-containing protein [Oscillospiraceae bacterium]